MLFRLTVSFSGSHNHLPSKRPGSVSAFRETQSQLAADLSMMFIEEVGFVNKGKTNDIFGG